MEKDTPKLKCVHNKKVDPEVLAKIDEFKEMVLRTGSNGVVLIAVDEQGPDCMIHLEKSNPHFVISILEIIKTRFMYLAHLI